ncbi:LPXTG cell wall anchor domain-containing protein [Listeria valentina]|uniref:LPXTG cell wall anchor domain-containing protein n=1 Tax=Listeria valentina TaxID=2705293 RepID=UPI001430401E|nr:LPXTG cell wall anchor domain-containing protein [Listeria valentina]
MKKTFLLASFCALFFIFPASGFASEPASHAESHAGIHFISGDENNDHQKEGADQDKSNSSSQLKKQNESNKGDLNQASSVTHLPKTGDQADSFLSLIGIVLISLYLIQNKNMKRGNNH